MGRPAKLSPYLFAIHIGGSTVDSRPGFAQARVMDPMGGHWRLPDELRELAAAQDGALLGTQLHPFVGRRQLRGLTSSGVLNKLWRNTYALPTDQADGASCGVRTRLTAAALSLGRPVTACLHTAAELYGADIRGDRRTHVLAAVDSPSALDGLVLHRPHLIRPHNDVDGRSVTDLSETTVRIAALERNPAKSLAVLDAALRKTHVRQVELSAVAAELSIRGVRQVRVLIPLADGRAESPGESWLRWVCIEAGLPAPTPQIQVTTGQGLRYRVDLGWPELRVGCEYEGVQFHTGAALHQDRERYNELQRAGWLMLGVTHQMIWQRREHLVAQIRSMLEARIDR